MLSNDLFEFAISCGEGTLLSYGVTDLTDDPRIAEEDLSNPALTFTLTPCGGDCVTGK